LTDSTRLADFAFALPLGKLLLNYCNVPFGLQLANS
jgi:hypothetical protein